MIYKNADIHNIAELVINESDKSIQWRRVPKSVIDCLEIEGELKML